MNNVVDITLQSHHTETESNSKATGTYMSGVECAALVLFVGKDQQDGVLQLLFLQHSHQLLLRYACVQDTLQWLGKDNEFGGSERLNRQEYIADQAGQADSRKQTEQNTDSLDTYINQTKATHINKKGRQKHTDSKADRHT